MRRLLWFWPRNIFLNALTIVTLILVVAVSILSIINVITGVLRIFILSIFFILLFLELFVSFLLLMKRLKEDKLAVSEMDGLEALPVPIRITMNQSQSAQSLGDRSIEHALREEVHSLRVLNANFADPIQSRVLEPDEGLVAEHAYDLLVDVGPRWETIKSIVSGKANFPEFALPPDRDGYRVQVVIVSQDFSPSIVSAQIWVPRLTGQSFPFEFGQLAEQPGPVALRLQAPAFPPSSDMLTFPAYARLCLYYENNLLQSAIVKVGVVQREGTRLDNTNTVNVDYVLTSTFQELEERFARRAVKFNQAEDSSSHPVMLNLTLNDDGANGHRIIISHLMESEKPFVPSAQIKCPPHGWVPYNPLEASDSLERARNKLQSIFYLKDSEDGHFSRDANGHPLFALDDQNSKSREQFKRDLLELASLGSELYDSIFTHVRPEGSDCKAARWKRDLENALTDPCIIQIARTSSTLTQYVFPWALLYAYPMVSAAEKEWKWCYIIDEEWSEEGIRRAPRSEEKAQKRQVCPYHFESWHAGNIICPYGFWGLKHIIEQPPSVQTETNGARKLRDAENRILIGSSLNLSVGVTRDEHLNVSRINKHFANLESIQGVRINPSPPAEDWNEVCTMLTAPEIVYFLCHDEYDLVRKKPFLNIGLRDGEPIHKIYPDTLDAWSRMPNGPDLDEWDKHHPLIFINGCHTADLKPGQVLNFVTSFFAMGASGVVGTEVSILLPVAIEVAESLFYKLARKTSDDTERSAKMSVGQALYEIRWELANKGNLLGLAYTLYGLADLQIVRDNQ